MVKPITKGFSLIETLIASVLLAALSLTLIQTAVTLNIYIDKSNNLLFQNWQRKNLIAHRDLILVKQNVNPISVRTINLEFIDTNNDGIDDTWNEILHDPLLSTSLVKTITEITYQNDITVRVISGLNTP